MYLSAYRGGESKMIPNAID